MTPETTKHTAGPEVKTFIRGDTYTVKDRLRAQPKLKLTFDERLERDGCEVLRSATSEEYFAVCARAKAGEFAIESFGRSRSGGAWFKVRRPQKNSLTLCLPNSGAMG